jgi:hypothetical protein
MEDGRRYSTIVNCVSVERDNAERLRRLSSYWLAVILVKLLTIWARSRGISGLAIVVKQWRVQSYAAQDVIEEWCCARHKTVAHLAEEGATYTTRPGRLLLEETTQQARATQVSVS